MSSAASTSEVVVVSKAKSDRKVFTSAKARLNRIPKEILEDPELKADMAVLPKNYNFEVPKTIWRIRTLKVRSIMFASSVHQKHFGARLGERVRCSVSIMSYGR